jgi:Calcium-binding EGF domain/HYR domain
MALPVVPRWVLQSAAGALVAVALNLAFTMPATLAEPEAAAQGTACAAGVAMVDGKCGDRCAPGFSGSPATGCVDVNECAISNGGCHRLSKCTNTSGSRTCSACPPDFAGDGYVGCFDVNECPNGDCSGRIPPDAANAPPPVIKTPGDVAAVATTDAGAEVTFTATATDPADGTRPVNCSPKSGSIFPVGKTTVSCWATNKRGKIGIGTLTVSVTRPEF